MSKHTHERWDYEQVYSVVQTQGKKMVKVSTSPAHQKNTLKVWKYQLVLHPESLAMVLWKEVECSYPETQV